MTKNDLIVAVASSLGLTQTLVKEVIEESFDQIVQAVADKRDVKLRGLGTFQLRVREGYVTHNNLLDREVEVPSRMGIRYLPSQEMREALRG